MSSQSSGSDQGKSRYHNDPYVRHLTFFAFYSILLYLIQKSLQNFAIFSSIIFIVLSYRYLQSKVSFVLDHILSESRDYAKFCPTPLISISILSIILSVITLLYSFSIPFSSYILAYIHAMLISLSIFLLSTSFQGVLIHFKVVTAEHIRSGIFGVIQRIVLVIRCSFIFAQWLNFLNTQKHYHTFTIVLYSLVKGVMIFYLTDNIIRTIGIYLHNKKLCLPQAPEALRTTECSVCMDTPKEQNILPCNHVFCYHCIMRWSISHHKCPFCRADFNLPAKIELSNGFIPFHVLLDSL